MLSNENLLNIQNEYITQLQIENTELKDKLHKAADDVLTADGFRAAAISNYNKICKECDELKKTIAEMRSAAAQRSSEDAEIRRLRAHNIQLCSQLDSMNEENRRLEQHLRSAENALIEKDKEIEDLQRTLLGVNKTAQKITNDETVGTLKRYENGELVESRRITQEEADEFKKKFKANNLSSFLNRISQNG